MAYNEYLADRVRQRMSSLDSIEEKKMMGGLIFMVNEKMCVGVGEEKESKEDQLMVRIGKLAYEDLLGQRGSTLMDFTGKPMRGFLFISQEGFDSEDDLDFWVEKALEFNQLIK